MLLNNENYFSVENQMKYMGVSQFKSFEQCQASALAEVTGNFEREKTTALLVGSYVDAHFEGTLDLFRAKNPEIFTKKGDLKAEYRKAEEIIQRIEQDNLFMEYMGGDKQVIMTGDIEGVPVKIKIDSYHTDKIVDLKIMKDFQPIYKSEQGRLNWVEAWQYDLQGAVYQEIVRQNTGKTLPFFLAAATKEKVTDLNIIQIPQEYLDVELERFKKNVQFYDAIKHGLIPPERCECCDYCKITKVLREPVQLGDLDFE
ncbi:MAG: PD-(D/E)XK nuclease-like domain-containing protein [Oscillospiraceae bacterium]|nr:PD-(D/E)XK nuclease-like domain-containing protein [Oscillospiraceae bacterium]